MCTPTLHVRNSDSPPRSKLIIKDIYITNGASRAVCMTLTALLRSAQDGVLVPIPQYPLYSASIQLHNGTLLPYYLDEKDNWSFSLPAIERTIMKACVTGETTPLPSFSFSFSFHLFVFFFFRVLVTIAINCYYCITFSIFIYVYIYIYVYLCVKVDKTLTTLLLIFVNLGLPYLYSHIFNSVAHFTFVLAAGLMRA